MNVFEGYRISSPFGWRISPINGAKEFHTGIDLVKSHQAPIYAFYGGEVIFAAEGLGGTGFGGYGNVAAIKETESNHLHVYAHLDSVSVPVGSHINKGDLIGKQGTTGNSTGSHLHYEIRKNYTPSYGWIAERENNCFEPTQYLEKLYMESMLMDLQVQINELQNQVKELKEQNAMSEVPEWAKEVVNKLVEEKVLLEPNGRSYDLYSILSILHRKEVI